MSNLSIDKIISVLSTDGKIKPECLPEWTGDNFVMVQSTNDAIQNGINLKAAFSAAVARVNPNGFARSYDNRVVVIIPPGKYDFVDTPLVHNYEYIDLMAMNAGQSIIVINSPNTLGHVIKFASGLPTRVSGLVFKQLNATTLNTLTTHEYSSVINTNGSKHEFTDCIFDGTNIIQGANIYSAPGNDIFVRCKFLGRFSYNVSYKSLKFDSCTGNGANSYNTSNNNVVVISNYNTSTYGPEVVNTPIELNNFLLGSKTNIFNCLVYLTNSSVIRSDSLLRGCRIYIEAGSTIGTATNGDGSIDSCILNISYGVNLGRIRIENCTIYGIYGNPTLNLTESTYPRFYKCSFGCYFSFSSPGVVNMTYCNLPYNWNDQTNVTYALGSLAAGYNLIAPTFDWNVF